MQRSKMAIWVGLTNSCEKKRGEKQRKNERYKDLNAEFQRIARRDKRAFFSDQRKEIEENNKLVLEKVEESEIKLPTYVGSWKKQESSRKTSLSALLTMPKPLTVWITINCGKF